MRERSESQHSSNRERDRDPGDAGDPAEPVKQLAENGAANESTEEIARQVDAAGGTSVGARCMTDETGRRGLSLECSDSDQHHADEYGRQVGQEQKRQAEYGDRQGGP